MSDQIYDVIIVGAGFAGVTAARELSNKGYKILVLEGRNRIGGRTWLDNRMGRELEMGGTYVHWNQPHMWAELTRYNLPLKESPTMEKAYWIADNDTLFSGSQFEMATKLMEGMTVFLKDTRKYFNRPFDPFYDNTLDEVDHLSVLDKLKEIEPAVSKEIYGLLTATWSEYASTDNLDHPGLAQAYRWAALAGHDMNEFQDTFELFSIKDGTKKLIESILGDADVELKLSTPVSVIEKIDGSHKITTRDGEEFIAKSVIAAIPINVIDNIEFKPPLSEGKQKIAAEKQTSKGIKVWAKVRGLEGAATMKAPPEYPVNSAHVEIIDGDEGYIMGFGSDEKKLDMTDAREVEKVFRAWLPNIEVIESTGHNWVADEFSQGTWGVLKKNQLSKYGQELRKSEDGLFLAGSDYANGWVGYMDGAIESGLTTSKRIEKYLKDKIVD